MAHNIGGRVVRETIEAGRTAPEITAEDIDAAATALFGDPLRIAPDVVRTALDPMENIRLRTTTGGPAPDTVRSMIAGREADLAKDRTLVSDVRRRIERATARLMDEARQAAGRAQGESPDGRRRDPQRPPPGNRKE